MLGQGLPRSNCGRVVAVIAAALAACVIAACAGTSAGEGVAPLDTADTHSSGPESSGPDSTGGIIPTGPDQPEGAAADGSRSGSDGVRTDPDDAEVAELLARFDSAISALYADPAAAGDDNHPLSVAWLAVVVGGSQLDREVRSEILAAGRDDSIRIVPDPQGVSFTNVAIDVTRDADGSLTWTNCGYAPGVAVDTVTGEVRDDNRSSTRGRGRAITGPDGEAIISELWDDETYLLGADEDDPCPALVEDAMSSATDGGR